MKRTVIAIVALTAVSCGVPKRAVSTSTRSMAMQISVARAAMVQCRKTQDEAQCARVAESLRQLEATNEQLAQKAQ